MILPSSTSSWTAAWGELVNAATLCVHNFASRRARALIQRVCDSVTVCVSLTRERKCCVKRSLAGDVSADAQPIRSQVVIANPALPVGRERSAGSDNRFRRGQPQKIATVQKHFRAEEIIIGGKRDRWIETHRDLHLLSGYGTFAISSLTGLLVNPVYDGVRRSEAGTHERCGERQAALGAVACRGINFNIRWRIGSGRDVGG